LNPTDSPSASTGPPTLSPITSPTCVNDKTKSVYVLEIDESEMLCEWVSKLPEDRCEQDCPCVEGEKKKNKYLCPLTCLPECIPTEPPSDQTRTPSNNPTLNPTDSPSEHPTIKPTKTPSKKPTLNPTDSPSASTGPPTLSPITSPTTDSPSDLPTGKPTKTLSSNPTSNPTDSPSEHPTSDLPCEDDDDTNIKINIGKQEWQKVCTWASEHPSIRCNQICPCEDKVPIRNICRKTCNNCLDSSPSIHSTITPTKFPTNRPTPGTVQVTGLLCEDSNDVTLKVNIKKGEWQQICTWASESPINRCDEVSPCEVGPCEVKVPIKNLCKKTCNYCVNR